MTLSTGNSKLAGELVRLLGLPKNTKAFELRVAADEIMAIRCEYYPEPPDDTAAQLQTAFAEYQLVHPGQAAGKAPRWFDRGMIDKLTAVAGDTVVLRYPGRLRATMHDVLITMLQRAFPDQRVLVIDGEAQLGVVARGVALEGAGPKETK